MRGIYRFDNNKQEERGATGRGWKKRMKKTGEKEGEKEKLRMGSKKREKADGEGRVRKEEKRKEGSKGRKERRKGMREGVMKENLFFWGETPETGFNLC